MASSLQPLQLPDGDLHLLDALAELLPLLAPGVIAVGRSADGIEFRRQCLAHDWESRSHHLAGELDRCPWCVNEAAWRLLATDPVAVAGRLRYLERQQAAGK